MNERPTHIDLFSGIGGFALAAEWAGFRTIVFVEIDKYCQKVLGKNFGAIPYPTFNGCRQGRTWRPDPNGSWKPEPPFCVQDIRDLDATGLVGCDLLTGGFPCQPYSVAGKRGGAADDRAIWPEMFRVIGEAKPAWILAENVPGIIPMELDNVFSDLESIGYACWSVVIPVCAVDARHRRERLWIIGRNISNDQSAKLQWNRDSRSRRNGLADACRWQPEPDVGRVANGIPARVDRLKGLGNAIVPQCAYEILREIRKLIKTEPLA